MMHRIASVAILAALIPSSAFAQDNCSAPCQTEVRLETVDLGTAIGTAQTAYDLAEKAMGAARRADNSRDIEDIREAIEAHRKAIIALEEAQDVLSGRIDGNEAAIDAIVSTLDPLPGRLETVESLIPTIMDNAAGVQDFRELGWFGVIGGGIGVDLGPAVPGIVNGATMLGTTDLGIGFQSKSWGVMAKGGYNPHFVTGGMWHGGAFAYGRLAPWFGLGLNLGASKSTFSKQETGNHLADFAGVNVGPQAMITAFGDGPLAVDFTLRGDVRIGEQWDYVSYADNKVRFMPVAGIQLRGFIDKPPPKTTAD